MASVQVQNLANTPDTTPLVDKDTGRITFNWNQWLTNVQIKINTINGVLVQIAGTGTVSGTFNLLSPLTTNGDLLTYNASNNIRLGIGATGQVLTVVGGLPAWATPAASSPLTTKGDLYTFSTVNARLPVGTDGYVLKADSTQPTGLSWGVGGGGGSPINIVSNTLTSYIVQVTDLPNSSSNVGWISSNVSTANYIQIDTHANQAIPVGAHLYVSEEGAGTTSIQALTGVTFVGASITGVAKGVGEAVQIAIDTWHIFGNLAYIGPPAAYAPAVMALSPSIYWRLAETSGTTAADYSGNGYTGTYTGTYTLGQTSLVSDAADYSVAFDGSTGRMYLDTAIGIGTSGTVMAWIKTTSAAGGLIAGFSNTQTDPSSAYDRFMYVDSAGKLRASTYNGGQQTMVSSATVIDGLRHFCVFTWGPSGTGGTLYLDGVLVASNASFLGASATYYLHVAELNFSTYPAYPSSYYLNGTIDEVAYFPTILTGTQIANVYANA